MTQSNNDTKAALIESLGFDPDALREKYREERDKRLRDDGNNQYVNVTGDFSNYIDDPYVEPGFTRDAIHDEVDVIIIGGGFGGLLTAARLREAGVDNIRLIEKGGDFGGTWYWNRYPGAACDVESYVYLPLLEELNFVPKEKYTHAPEILAHSQNIGKKYGLYERTCFQTEVTDVSWEETSQRWVITTSRGDKMRAKFVSMSNGPLNRPKLPGIPGINSYQGHTFHTSRWDYDYTGGNAEGNLTGLKDKKVAIIGTGATAVQCIPHLGAAAKQLYVFQRTPSSIDVRDNRPTDPQWAENLKPGWQKRRMENFNNLLSGAYEQEDLVNDGWTDIFNNLLIRFFKNDNKDFSPKNLGKEMEIADFQKMEQIRARVDEVVEDSATAESLKPYYRQFCKRPCFHDEYLKTFNRSNVTLVDTQGKGVEAITENAVIANGKTYEVDCIIYATGFEVGTEYTRRCGYELQGRDGIKLKDKWENGVRTFHGLHSKGFPNCFICSQSQSAFTVNFPHAMNEQAVHIAYIIKHCLDNDIEIVEASEAAENQWVDTIISMSRFQQKFQESCTPGYYNNEGKPDPKSIQNGPYGGGSIAFFNILRDWREEGEFAGLELSYSKEAINEL